MRKRESLQECDFAAVEKSFAWQTDVWSSLGSKLELEITEELMFTVKNTQLLIIMMSVLFFSPADVNSVPKKNKNLTTLS